MSYFSSIPLSRRLLYLVVLLWVPILFWIAHFWKQKNEWKEVSNHIHRVQLLSQKKREKQAVNNLVRTLYSASDSAYLTHQLEPLIFLKKEKESLEKLMLHPNFTSNEVADARYAFLSEGKNRLQFTEVSTQSLEGVHEVLETLTHPVEIDAQDLKELLFRIEANRPAKPLLIVTDFKLSKKRHVDGNEVFECGLSLLKREFFHE